MTPRHQLVHDLLALALFALLALGQIQRVTLTTSVAFYGHDVVVSAWLLLLMLEHHGSNYFRRLVRFQPNQKLLITQWLSRHWLSLLALGWIVWGWGWAGWQQTLSPAALLYALRLGVYSLWAYFLYVQRPMKHWELRFGLVAAGVWLAVAGLLQYVFVPDTRFLAILGWDDHYYRLISTQLDPNFTGLLLVMTIFYSLSLSGFHQLKTLRFQSTATMIALLILILSLALTFSRASYLSLVVGMSVAWLLKKHQGRVAPSGQLLPFIFIGIILVGTIFLAPKPTGEGVNLLRTSTINSRLASLQRDLSTLAPTQWVWGRGLFNPQLSLATQPNYATQDHANLPDNWLVMLLNGTGLGGLLLALGLLTMGVRWFLRRNDWENLAVLAAILTHGFFNNSAFQAFVVLFFLVGLVSHEDKPSS